MDPITIAMGLAQFAPQILKWVTGSDKVEDAANKVVGIAQAVTGVTNGKDALSAISADPNIALQFRLAVMANEADLDKAYLADVQNARSREIEIAKVNASPWWWPSTLTILTFVVVVGGGWIFVTIESTDVRYAILPIVASVIQYYYGTTKKSADKDETIASQAKALK